MPFIAFEGLDGSGKSTLLRELEQQIESRNWPVFTTREPGGTPLAEDIREIILRREVEEPVPRCEILLYEASRAQHVEQRIRPQLEKGQWVLCDRFIASAVAFQEAGRLLKKTDIEWLNHFATDGLVPDLTILLDLTVEASAQRQEKRRAETGEPADRLESEKFEFHQRVRNSYLEQSKNEKWFVLDASKSVEELKSQLVEFFEEKKWLNYVSK